MPNLLTKYIEPSFDPVAKMATLLRGSVGQAMGVASDGCSPFYMAILTKKYAHRTLQPLIQRRSVG